VIRLAVRRVRPERVDELRAWLMALNTDRVAEALATLADEGCAHEIGALVETSDGPLLVYAMEVEDEERSVQAAEHSEHAIDAEHRAVMGRVLAGEPSLEVLLDLRR